MSDSGFSMLDLFKTEVDTQTDRLSQGLLDLELDPTAATVLESLMRAAHSVKGAAKMVDVQRGVDVAHVMEDVFVAAQNGKLVLHAEQVDVLLNGVDTLRQIAHHADDNDWLNAEQTRIDELVATIKQLEQSTPAASAPESPSESETASAEPAATASTTTPAVSNVDPAMLELFRVEADTQLSALSEGLLALEENPSDSARLEALMRAAHSVKGAARMVDVEPVVRLAHVMEDGFVAAQKGKIRFNSNQIDLLLKSTDLLLQIAKQDGIGRWGQDNRQTIDDYEKLLSTIPAGEALPDTGPVTEAVAPITPAVTDSTDNEASAAQEKTTASPGRSADTAIRVSAESLNRLMGLAGEVQVEARWLRPFANSLLQLKYRQTEMISLLDRLRDALVDARVDDHILGMVSDIMHRSSIGRQGLAKRMEELEEFDRRSHNLAARLNREVISSRMRPFADGIHGFQRMVRDISRSLHKRVKLEIQGLTTKVDRDILEKIEAPLNHLIRNALDHGIELPDERSAAGKPAQATIKLEAMHSSGMLSIVVEDDGRGMDLEKLREKIVKKKLVTEEMARDLSEAELMDFIFLPGFSTRDSVSEISGRGVGLDVVHSVMQEMHGIVHAISNPGKGMRFHLQLPLTLSVMRSLMVEIAGEIYAFPLAQINRTLRLHRDHIETLEGRQYFTLGNQHIGLLTANQVLGLPEAPPDAEEASVVVLGERLERYGFVVDRFLGERSLVVQKLDARLGKIKDINSAAILENGNPCLIIDVDDMLRSADLLISGSRPMRIESREQQKHRSIKRVLVVDDSITVREVERNMLVNRGYEVDVAVDGMDGWNAVRTGHYDLVISDIDMPRMNGFEFVEHIKGDATLRSLPVMIVSYKDREEDRTRGLEVGADYYLTKGSFQDETLLDAVADLIGEADV